MTAIEEAMKKAEAAKANREAKLSNDINSYVWKGPKINGVQETTKLVDATFEQLQKYYNHCMQMLYNEDSKNPGRITLLNIISDQIQRCRAELLIRWLRSEKLYTATKCFEDLRQFISLNKDVLTPEVLKTYPIAKVMKGLPLELENIPVTVVMSACLDNLGKINLSHLTINFITKLGLCFTQQEMQKDLYRKDPETGKAMNRIAIVKELMGLSPDMMLRINYNTGLTYNEFKLMYNLKTGKYNNDKYTKDKYSILTTDLLKLLSNKILYLFQNQCEMQAKQWQDKINEILKVAEHRGWDVTRTIE